MSNINKYQRIHRCGVSEYGIYFAASHDGLDEKTCIAIVTEVCGMSEEQARTVRDRIAKYKEIWHERRSADAIYRTAQEDGLDFLPKIAVLCNICHLTFAQAKDVAVKIDSGVESLSQYQGKFAAGLREILGEQHDQPTDEKPRA